jgi:hypothetical protein
MTGHGPIVTCHGILGGSVTSKQRQWSWGRAIADPQPVKADAAKTQGGNESAPGGQMI